MRAAAVIQLLALILLPPVALVLSAWLFALWSHTSLHTLLCLILAPVVIVAHSYAIWQLTEGAIVLTRSRMCWLKAIAMTCAVVIDLAACGTVGRWFL